MDKDIYQIKLSKLPGEKQPPIDIDVVLKKKHEQAILITGVMLRAEGNDAIVELEINDTWYQIIACDMRGSFSHIVEPYGIQHCIETGKPTRS